MANANTPNDKKTPNLTLAEARAEVRRLTKENARLRAKLGRKPVAVGSNDEESE